MWRPLSVATACAVAAVANGLAQAEPTAPSLPIVFDAEWHGQTGCEPLFENAALRAAR
jgi:hypothetical protein